jgi:hypothetical protein
MVPMYTKMNLIFLIKLVKKINTKEGKFAKET